MAAAINREVPDGGFSPHVRMLSALGAQGWNTLSRATTIRLEKAITDDIAAAAYDAQSGMLIRGALGTWVRFFYAYFKNQIQVRVAINQLLRRGWASQNYVGNYLITLLPRIATTAVDRDNFIKGIAKAVTDNAWSVNANIRLLPEDWRVDIALLTKSGSDEAI